MKYQAASIRFFYSSVKINSNRFIVLSNNGYRLKQVIVGDMLQNSTVRSCERDRVVENLIIHVTGLQ